MNSRPSASGDVPADRHSPSAETPGPVSVPLLDVSRANAPLHDEMLAAVAGVFDSGRFLFGPEVQELERSVAEYSGADHAVSCASGSDALLLALMAQEIGPGDEVIVPSFTFFATASAVWRLGAKIVFADIDPQTFNLDPGHFEAAITARTKAVIPVHLFGRMADMTAICDIAARHGLHVVEDAAQSIGSKHHDRAAGSWGHVGCFSFYPTKNLGGCGDGGMLTTGDAELADRLRLYAGHGMRPRYVHRVVGINSRLDSVQAAALQVKLKQLDRWTSMRRENAARYAQLFADAGLDEHLETPSDDLQGLHVWNQYTIRVRQGRRDDLRQALMQCSVGTEVYYPIPLHQQECFKSLGYATGSLPESERAAGEVLSLPIFPGLTADEQAVVVGRMQDYFAHRQSAAA